MKEEFTHKDIIQRIDDLREDFNRMYVTKGEFAPVKGIAYGMVGAILLGVLALILSHVGVQAVW